ncbi:MAG: ABC transporter ATP-binding protein [Candidatus Paracaedimonas acanthamoebae]|uniref:ABC transporter ATP-binding protein n=1 Tax=Candidatus Paracaedimonas acanthamoebae TaxID=244581 RepID=A0A8J7TV14_9PROT|nr:ABC transporter ATP-binding protein [Candidatus Paracaedimonas acanthamoebae]
MTKKKQVSFRDPTTRFLVKRLLTDYTRPYIGRICLGLISMIIVAATSVSSAKLIEPIINDIFVAKDATMIWPLTVGICVVFLLKGLSTYAESVTMAYVGQRIIADLQADLFNHLLEGDLAFYHATPSGEIVSRFMNDVTKLHTAVTGTLTNIGKDGLMLIGFIGFMFYQDWFMASISFFVVPVAILPVVKIGKKMRKASANIQKETATLTILLTQAFQGIRLIKSYCMEKYERHKIHETIEEICRKNLKAVRVRAASHPIMEFLGGLAIALVIIYGGHAVVRGQQNPGTFFSFITALLMMYEPLKRLANLNANLQDQLASASRVFEFLDLKAQVVDLPQAKMAKITKGEIRFDNVNFSYNKESQILNLLTFEIPAGKTVALVGTSGAGKSTIMNLIPRFYDVTEGEITIDGVDVRHLNLTSLRQNIALVSQDVILFDDTIRRNIEFGYPGASENAIIEAAKAAAAHEFIIELPQGYDTPVGEHGVRLSGGQRQRLSIARAILKNAPILLLDEPTSALDAESERKVKLALKTLMTKRTTLIIAHRLATIVSADIIYVIENGQVIASGKHHELITNNSRYAQLCKAQFAEPHIREK